MMKMMLTAVHEDEKLGGSVNYLLVAKYIADVTREVFSSS